MTKAKKNENISIAVCTYNRAEQLRLTLESINQCKDELKSGDEIIVVDNNSSDQTKEVVHRFKEDLPITYRFEAKQGLSHARNRAIANFKNDTIAFIDDDITVLPSYITSYREAFSNNLNHGFFGGRISVDWKNGQPMWLKGDSYSLLNGLFVRYKLVADAIYSDKTSLLLPYGANFALTKDLVEKVGYFNVELGVSGKSILRGEETEYFYRSLDLGFTGQYVEAAHVEHRFDVSRLDIPYLYRYGLSKGFSEIYLENCNPERSYSKIALYLLKAVNQLRKRRKDRFYECIINIGIQQAFNSNANKQLNRSD